MKKTVIVNIPMTIDVKKTVFASDDRSIPVSEKKFSFPVLSFLSETMKNDDEVNFLLLVKKSPYSKCDMHVKNFRNEAAEAAEKSGAKLNFEIIESEFSEDADVHEHLLSDIVDKVECSSHILADITYGSKDVPIVVFSALNFSEKFLGCEIDNILYGQGFFDENGKFISSKICDMSPLYSLNSLTNSINCSDADKARKMLKTIIGK